MAQARAGIGTLLKMGDGASPEVFTTIAQCNNIGGPSMKADTYESTNHDTTGGWKTFITGLKEGGEVPVKLFFDVNEATHKDAATGLIGVFKANTVKNWQIVVAGTSPAVKWTFAGPITALNFAYPVDNIQTCDATIKVSGAPALG